MTLLFNVLYLCAIFLSHTLKCPCRIKKAGIPCPDVVILKKHILVMSFIGQDHVPAPKLKDAILSSEDMKKAYYQVLNVSIPKH